MYKIQTTPKINSYAQVGMIGKHIYMKRNTDEHILHYIYIIDSIENTNPIKYKVSKLFMLSIPKDLNMKAYVYNNYNEVQLTLNDVLYEMDKNEWVDVFREFVSFEGVLSKHVDLSINYI